MNLLEFYHIRHVTMIHHDEILRVMFLTDDRRVQESTTSVNWEKRISSPMSVKKCRVQWAIDLRCRNHIQIHDIVQDIYSQIMYVHTLEGIMILDRNDVFSEKMSVIWLALYLIELISVYVLQNFNANERFLRLTKSRKIFLDDINYKWLKTYDSFKYIYIYIYISFFMNTSDILYSNQIPCGLWCKWIQQSMTHNTKIDDPQWSSPYACIDPDISSTCRSTGRW